MQVTGMLHGATLFQSAGFPAAEVHGPNANEDEIRGLFSRADDLKAALANRRRGAVPVKHEVSFSLVGSTRFRACGRNMDKRTPASHCRFVP